MGHDTTVRCKFKCYSVERTESGASNITLRAVTSGSEENKKFFKWTPSAELKLATVNPEAAAQFEPGKEYFIDITAVTAAE